MGTFHGDTRCSMMEDSEAVEDGEARTKIVCKKMKTDHEALPSDTLPSTSDKHWDTVLEGKSSLTHSNNESNWISKCTVVTRGTEWKSAPYRGCYIHVIETMSLYGALSEIASKTSGYSCTLMM